MKAPVSSLFILSFAFLLDEYVIPASAVRLPLVGRRRLGAPTMVGRRVEERVVGFGKRASISGTPDLEDTSDLDYFANITLGGEQFQVLIDTGR